MVDFYRKGANSFSDQYSDGKAARVWEKYIGGTRRRTDQYRRWVVDLLRDNDCQHVLDTACGTGYVNYTTASGLYHATVMSERELSPVRLSSVCLSVVCNVRVPYSGGSNFR